MKTNFLSIFRKGDAAKTDEPAMSKLATALYSKGEDLHPPVATTTRSKIKDAPLARLLFAFDATGSREGAWATSMPLTDELLAALPGHLEVMLAVHGGGKVHTFTSFARDAGTLRDRAAGVRCKAGYTKLLDILTRSLGIEHLGTIVYVGDAFEESERSALKLADALAARNSRLIILHDITSHTNSGATIFAAMARRTGGAVMPFDASALPALRDLLSAVAVLAVGGPQMLAAKQEEMPAARLLLQHVKGDVP